LEQPFRFSTKYYDGETGLMDFGYRFYVADTGRWLTRDPIGLKGGINLYIHVENNPVNGIDPFGLSKTGGKHANKNKPMNVGDFNKNSSAKEVRDAINNAKKAGNLKHAKNLKGLLKVILRGAKGGNPYVLVLGLTLELLLYPDEAHSDEYKIQECQ